MSLARHIADIVMFLVVVLAPLPLCLSVLVATEDEERRRGPAHSVLVILACWCITETAVGIVLGLAHGLALTWMMVAETLVLAGGVVCLSRVLRASPRASAAAAFRSTWRPDAHAVVILGALACLGVALLWTLSVQPINEWDSLFYHLPTLANWYEAGHFARLAPQTDLTTSYPYGWEVVSALLLMPFREDFLVALPNLIAWILLGLSIACIGLELGAATTAGVAAAALLLTLSGVADNVNTIHVDIALGAFFMAALYFALLHLQTKSMKWLGLCLAALGIVAGVKTSGLAYSALLLALLLALRSAGGTRTARQVEKADWSGWAIAIVGICCCLLTGGFWYIKNWVELGNPLGPVAVRIGGLVLFPGSIQAGELRATTLLHVFRPLSGAYWRSALSDGREYLGLSFIGLALLALAALPSLLVRKKGISNRRLLGLLGLAALTGLLHAATPLSGQYGSNLRYAVPFYGTLALVAAAGATAARVPGLALVAIVLVGVATHLLALRMTFMLVPVAASLAWLVWKARGDGARRAAMPRVAFLSIVVVSAAALLLVTFFARQRRAYHRTVVYGPIVAYIGSEVRSDETIGYLMSPQSYLLYGTDFRRKVVYLPLRSRDRAEWLDYLARNRIAVVAAGPAPRGSAEQQFLNWLDGPEGPLVRVFGTDPGRPYLYRIRQGQRGTSGRPAQ